MLVKQTFIFIFYQCVEETVNSVMHKFQFGSIQKMRFKMGLFYVLLNVLKPLLMKTAIYRVCSGGGLLKK